MSRLARRPWGKDGHRYYLDGEPIPGVTTILKALGSSPDGLMTWAAKHAADYAISNFEELMRMPDHDARLALAAKVHKSLNAAAKAQGSLIHELVVPVLEGATAPELRELGDPDVRTKMKQARALIRDWQLRPVRMETYVWSERYRYAGTFDLVATSPLLPGSVLLCDWKTNNSGIYPDAALQLAAYADADFYVGDDGEDHPIGELGITETCILWLRPFQYAMIPTASLAADAIALWRQVHDLFESYRRLQGGLLGDELHAPGVVA